MSDLATLRARVALLLGDAEMDRYTESLLDEAIRQALGGYSTHFPQVKTEDISASGDRIQVLSTMVDMQQILEIIYPYGETERFPETYTGGYTYYWKSAVPWLELHGDVIPICDDTIRLVYAADHTIKDLEDAAATSVLARHYTAFVNGAAGYAAMVRANSLQEKYGGKSDDAAKLLVWANGMLQNWEKFLYSLGHCPSPSPPVGNDGDGWRLDVWDAADAEQPFGGGR